MGVEMPLGSEESAQFELIPRDFRLFFLNLKGSQSRFEGLEAGRKRRFVVKERAFVPLAKAFGTDNLPERTYQSRQYRVLPSTLHQGNQAKG